MRELYTGGVEIALKRLRASLVSLVIATTFCAASVLFDFVMFAKGHGWPLLVVGLIGGAYSVSASREIWRGCLLLLLARKMARSRE